MTDLPEVHKSTSNIQRPRKLSEAEQVTVEVEASYVPSVDLVTLAQGHLAFLRKINNIAHYLRQPHVIANAMRRYENYWLPLISQFADKDSSSFLPPIDVHWIWYVHMLCPRQYRNDCIDVIGMVPDHRFIQGKFDTTSAQVKTQKMWMSFCVGEKYNIDFSQIDVETTYHKTSIRYQLAEASYKQLDFNYHVSLPHYLSPAFLELATQRYLKFINLKRLYKGATLSPGYDMYLIWHSHQLSPRAYIHDTSHWLGYILNNDDASDLQGKHAKFIMSEEDTKKVWHECYGEDFNVPGSNHRGIDPAGRMAIMSTDQISEFRSNAVKFSLHTVVLDDSDTTMTVKGSMTVSFNRLELGWYDVKKSQVQYILPLNPTSFPFQWHMDSLSVKDAIIDASGKMYVSIQMQTKPQGGCCTSRWVNEAKIDIPSRPLSTYINNDETTHFTLEEGQVKIALQGCLKEMPMIFSISQIGPFVPTSMNQENRDLVWSPLLSLPESSRNAEHICQVANHVVKSQSGFDDFKVRITHSLSLKNSIIQIFHQSRLLAVSHLVDKDQLPFHEQVDPVPECLSLNPRKFQPTMLIKNNEGDWAMLMGRWRDFKSASDPGYLFLDVQGLSRERLPDEIFVLRKDSKVGTTQGREMFVNLGQARIDLKNGSIAMRGDCSSIAEHLALTFSVLVLYCLCEPRSSDKPGVKRQEIAKTETRGSDFNPSSLSILQAAGYGADTPSTSYLWWLQNESHSGNVAQTVQDRNNNNDLMECPWQPKAVVSNGEVSGQQQIQGTPGSSAGSPSAPGSKDVPGQIHTKEAGPKNTTDNNKKKNQKAEKQTAAKSSKTAGKTIPKQTAPKVQAAPQQTNATESNKTSKNQAAIPIKENQAKGTNITVPKANDSVKNQADSGVQGHLTSNGTSDILISLKEDTTTKIEKF